MFCMDVGCSGPERPAPNNSRNQTNPDDNFDVSSRLIQLEELDITKQAWKDLYGRTGIKKGYNGLFLEKSVTNAYATLATTTTEADYNAAAQQFQTVLDRAQKDARHSFEDTYYASADVALLSDSFVDNAAEFLLKRLKEPIREVKETFNPAVLLKNQPVLFIPSGALTGFKDSAILKSALDEYVKNGGTLIILTQKYGYDYAAIPTPDGKPITGYGWEEDINCFADAFTINSWHQMLSGQKSVTPTANVDGYFTSIPDNATVLLRRTANGQPALFMYEHGQGRVIVSSMYSDWAYGHGQTSNDEIALIRDMIAWAKKPATLPELKPGEAASVPLTLTNSTATDAATVKLQIYNPDHSALLSEQTVGLAIPPGQSAQTTVTWQSGADAPLGIYHIDYILMDSAGNVIQPQAETDSGRFAVSNPPANLLKSPEFNFAVNSDSEKYARGADAAFTVTTYNNSDAEKTITAKYFFPHHYWETGEVQYGGDWSHRDLNLTKTVTVPPKNSASFAHLLPNARAGIDRLWAYFYDESGKEIGMASRGFFVFTPAVNLSTRTDKELYSKGETVNVAVSLQNGQNVTATGTMQLRVADPTNLLVYSATLPINLAANAAATQPFSFPLPATAQGGSYTISTEVLDSANTKIGGDSAAFELPLSTVVVTPQLPAAWNAGDNTLSFALANNGKIAVRNGTLDVAMKDPDGAVVATAALPFALEPGAGGTMTATLALPPLKFGSYTLLYAQSDETRSGKPVAVTLPNSPAIVATLDKPSYRIRETANLALQLTGSRFNLDNLIVTVALQDAAVTVSQTVTVTAGQPLSLNRAIPLPETLTVGQHAVTATLALPGGSTSTQSLTLTVPQSALSLTLGQSAFVSGSAISPLFANSGGVDTPAEYRLTLYDARSAQIADKSATETVPAGGTLTTALAIPAGAANGSYTLAITYRDTRSGRTEMVKKPVTVTGVKAGLTLKSDKQAYLNTETITALSGIANSDTALDGGRLHLQVTTAAGSQQQKTWTSQFDWQQGVRNGVDTYGVNDWKIFSDDFSGNSIDTHLWAEDNNGTSTQKQITGELVQSVGPGGGSTSLAGNGYPLFEGDLDIQVDFKLVNWPSEGESWAIFRIETINKEFRLERIKIQASNTDIYRSSYWNGSSWTYSQYINTSDLNGKFRITKTGMTASAYYWSNGMWSLLWSCPIWDGPSNARLWTTNDGAGNYTEVHWDNVTLNSGRLSTQNETIDSVRLLPLNDNFDDGAVNADRWIFQDFVDAVAIVNHGVITESGGKKVISLTNGSHYQTTETISNFKLSGDFDIQVNWSEFTSTIGGEGTGIELGIGSDLANYSYIKRCIIGSTHQYLRGIKTNGSWSNYASSVTADTGGKFRVTRVGSTLRTYYWNGTAWTELGSAVTFGSQPVGMTTKIWMGGDGSASGKFDNFVVAGKKFTSSGIFNFKEDAGRISTWQTLTWNSTQPTGTSLKFRTRTAATEADLTTAIWSDYQTASGAPITSPAARWIEIEATLSTTDTNITPLLHDLTVTYGNNPGDVLWQTDVPVSLAQSAVSDLTNAVGTIGAAGKYYLQGVLTSATGQTIANAEAPFFVAQGNTVVSILPDKKRYRPGETVTITGEVRNLATAEAANLAFVLKTAAGGAEQIILASSYTIPAGGSQQFSVTTVAGSDGLVNLSATVTQNGSILAQVADQYEVVSPRVTATLAAPDSAGDAPFTVTLSLTNGGKTDAIVAVTSPFATAPELLTVPAGQTRLLQYSQQIAGDTADSFTLSGDLTQTITKTVKYGLAGSVALTPQAIYPEGRVAVPLSVVNNGLLDGRFDLEFRLSQGSVELNRQAMTYAVATGGSVGDSLIFDLAEGNYQLAAAGQKPALAATTGFQVRKEVKAALTLAPGAQSGVSLPATVGVTNLGYNAISGTVRLTLRDDAGVAVWSAVQEAELPQQLTPATQNLAFAINLSALKPASYTIVAELLDSANRQLAAQSAPFVLSGPTFSLTRTPAYQTVPAGGSAAMTFMVKNSGNQEGRFDLSFKADDLLDAVRSEWLKPGEEKEVTFTFQTAGDLDEKDYSAVYRLKSAGATVTEGTLAYRLTGLNLAVTATLDKPAYTPGDTATLTLAIARQDAATSVPLFARVNYNGFEEKREFVLSGSQGLTFNVPLAAITGEKLFYGIYHQTGRSIHLNTIYIRKADAALSIDTDKQVYGPGETMTVTTTGTAVGNLTLTGPGDFSATFAFSGSDSRTLTLQATMTAGTYNIAGKLVAADGSSVTASQSFDVAGIQVKIKEAMLDKAKYAATDSMALSLTIESNQDLAATVRTWVVDPSGTYTPAGEGSAALIAATPQLSTQHSQLTTASTGIHKLVYGVYQGDLLLASGAKAFDIGDAVLMGLATDRSDYPDLSQSVKVKADLYRTVPVGIELFLDGMGIKSDSVPLAGFVSYSFAIAPEKLTPGLHTVKAVMTNNGLTSSREVRFTYGSNLPDLTVRIAGTPLQGSVLPLVVTVANQGKTAAGATTVALYDGDPAAGGSAIATLNVPALAAGAGTTLSYSWSVLGKAGTRTLYVVVDPDNLVTEFVKANNRALTVVPLPNVSIGVATTKTSYRAHEDTGITTTLANLSPATATEPAILKVRIASASGTVVDLPEQTVQSVATASAVVVTSAWNTGSTPPGSYTLTARLMTGTTEVAASSASFVIEATRQLSGSMVLEKADVSQGVPIRANFTLTNAGNVDISGTVRGTIVDPTSQVAQVVSEKAVTVPLNGTFSGSFTLATDGLSVKQYAVQMDQVAPEQVANLASVPVNILDGIPPVMTASAPVPDTTYPAVVPLAVSATDNASGVDRVDYQIDGRGWLSLALVDQAAGRFESAWVPVAADNGPHSVQFRAVDRAGNTSLSAPVSFTVQLDVTPPRLSLSTLPDGAYTAIAVLNVAGTVSDDWGLKELLINGKFVPIGGDGSFSYPLLLQSGANLITTTAVDLSGNRTTDVRTINLDLVAPLLVINAPADNGVTASPLLTVSGTVNESAVVEVKVRDTVTTAEVAGVDFLTTVTLLPGLNTIEVTAADLAGNRTSQKRTIVLDDTKPSLTITSPSQDLLTNQSGFILKGTVSDPLSMVGVTVTMGLDTFDPPVMNDLFEQQLTFTQEKPYEILVTATDGAGNTVTVQRNIIYDATGPLLTISPVITPTSLRSQVLSGTKEDGSTVTVTCPSAIVGAVAYPTTTTWQATLTGFAEGTNTIAVSSFDAAGNQSTVKATIVVNTVTSEVVVKVKPKLLWPPNHRLVPVKLKARVFPSSIEINSVIISVVDEYGKYNYKGLTNGSTVYLEAWRKGDDPDGRVYTITAVATDRAGNRSTGVTTVIVPHSVDTERDCSENEEERD